MSMQLNFVQGYLLQSTFIHYLSDFKEAVILIC